MACPVMDIFPLLSPEIKKFGWALVLWAIEVKMSDTFFISTDKNKLEVDIIHRFLSERSYWAKGRDLETVQKSIDHSLCFGIYRNASRKPCLLKRDRGKLSQNGYLPYRGAPPFRAGGLHNEKDEQIVGFGRVVTDYAVFAYIMDVFVLEEYRGKGLGKKLVEYIVNYPELKNLKRWQLATTDAHSLYKRYGFSSLAAPEKQMEKVDAVPPELSLSDEMGS